MAVFFLQLKTSAIAVTIISILLFFVLSPHISHSSPSILQTTHRRSLLKNSTNSYSCSSIFLIYPHERCSFSRIHCNGDSIGLVNYYSLHFCFFQEKTLFSTSFLFILIMLHFHVLVKTAQDRFSVVVTKLSDHLSLSPSMGAVTLLALGNGAPDVFASLAAVRGGHPRVGFGAILSAGTFVSAFVVGFVAIYAAPFSLDPAPFIRDVFFYLIAALFLFYVYLSAEIYIWQAVGLVGFYVFFVGFVFWMDLGMDGGRRKSRGGINFSGDVNGHKSLIEHDRELGKVAGNADEATYFSGFRRAFAMISKAWEVPVCIALKLTIPQTEPKEWSRFYLSANIALCPLALVYSCSAIMPLHHPIIFLLPETHLPLWSIVLFSSSSLALLHFTIEKKPPKTQQIPLVLAAFIMSVFWISTIAGELLNCLAALGALLELPPLLLGLTVLAWGNSIGDLVADVAVARAGQPAMAMAGCFAGPMFNMLVGLGSALLIQTVKVFPNAYKLNFHLGIVVAFMFLILSLMGSLVVVTWYKFRVLRFWGFSLVALYVVFIILSLVVAKFFV